MRVVIPAISEDCPAALALRKEGVSFDLVLMVDDYSYAATLSRLWSLKESFILLEHDIVPWPGALNELMNCLEAWCSFEYPLAPNTLRPALGCTKIQGRAMKLYPLLPTDQQWIGRHWTQMDGKVCSALQTLVGKTHIHKPPVAHVKK